MNTVNKSFLLQILQFYGGERVHLWGLMAWVKEGLGGCVGVMVFINNKNIILVHTAHSFVERPAYDQLVTH